MLTTPNKNNILTDEQQSNLEEYNRRLLNFEAEINTAQKHLKSLKVEIESTMKEKKYQGDLLEEAQKKTENSKSILSELNSKIETLRNDIKNSTEQAINIGQENLKKERILEEQEKRLNDAEFEHSQKVEELKIKSSQLSKDMESIQSAKEAFLKATETVQW